MKPTKKYAWAFNAIDFKPISPDETGHELERIRLLYGELQAPAVVEESRSDSAVLHPCFEWDDTKAARRFRVRQARKIIQCIGTMHTTQDGQTEVMRYYVNVRDPSGSRSYHRMPDALTDEQLRPRVLKELQSTMMFFKNKYKAYKDLAEIFSTVEGVLENFLAESPNHS